MKGEFNRKNNVPDQTVEILPRTWMLRQDSRAKRRPPVLPCLPRRKKHDEGVTMSDQELKPCPFCSSTWKSCFGYDELKHKSTCYFKKGHVFFDTDGGLRTEWNTRTPDPMLEELAGALEKALDHGLFKREYITEIFHVWGKYQQSKVQP